MIVFWDTSAFVPLVVQEAGSATAVRLWESADRVIASRLLYVEAVAALAMAPRIGRLDSATHRAARAALNRLHGSLDCVEVTALLVERAAELAEQFDLRGYDAVHCAAAEAIHDDDTVIATGDRDLLAACQRMGMHVAAV